MNAYIGREGRGGREESGERKCTHTTYQLSSSLTVDASFMTEICTQDKRRKRL